MNFIKLKDRFPNAHISLLVKYSAEFCKNSNEFSLDLNDLNIILDSSEFTIEQKEIIINTNAEIIFKDNFLKEKAFNILNIWQREKIDFLTVEMVFECGSIFSDKIKLLNIFMSKFKNEEITRLLSLLGEPYSLIVQSENPVVFEEDSDNITLVENLKKNSYIHKYKKADRKIIVYKNLNSTEIEDKGEPSENREDGSFV